jgi:hypothetical protein
MAGILPEMNSVGGFWGMRRWEKGKLGESCSLSRGLCKSGFENRIYRVKSNRPH